MSRLAPLLASGALLLAAPAEAVTYEEARTGDGTVYIVITGPFEFRDTADGLAQVVARSGASFVTFDSPGGNVDSAMRHGRMIRTLGLDTLQIRAADCASACSLAFLGGVRRSAEAGSIGVHRSSFAPDFVSDPNAAVAAIQQLTAQVMSYIAEMGADPTLLSISYSYDVTDMRYLSTSEMRQFRITNDAGSQQVAEAAIPYAPASPPPRSSLSVQSATELVQNLLTMHTLVEGAAMPRLRQTYAAKVDYYGKSVPLAEVVRDKQDYFRRWPERAYEVEPGTVTVSCTGPICNVSGVYRWAVRSYPRNRQAAGAAAFTYVIDTSQGIKVVGEASEVTDRYKLR